MIARCVDVADVMAAVNFARDQKLLLAVRGGGHNGGGLGVCDDGLVIDLSGMRDVRVDPTERTVRVGGGATWGDVDHATHAFGLACPSGIISTTGVGGLTLGGGIGHLTRKLGLAIDNLLEVDMVLADGRFVHASAEENPDLFWGIRGGGGNFGVVTSFLFRLHPVKHVIGGPTLWHLDKAAEVMRWYRDFIRKAPPELNGFFAFLTVPPVPPFPEALHLKTDVRRRLVLHRARERSGRSLRTDSCVRSAGALRHRRHAVSGAAEHVRSAYPPGHQWYWRADFVNELSDAAIAVHTQFGAQLPDAAIDHAPLSDRREGASRSARTTPRSATATRTGQRSSSASTPTRRSATRSRRGRSDYWEALHPLLGRRRLRQLHDGRGTGSGAGDLPRQLRAARELKRKYDPGTCSASTRTCDRRHRCRWLHEIRGACCRYSTQKSLERPTQYS